jgi:hypothetical protein
MHLRHRFVALGAIFSLFATAAPAQLNSISFKIRNLSPEAINEIFVNLSSESNWGSDRLGANVLHPGTSITIEARSCINDIRIVFKSGRAIDRRHVDICAHKQMDFR